MLRGEAGRRGAWGSRARGEAEGLAAPPRYNGGEARQDERQSCSVGSR